MYNQQKSIYYYLRLLSEDVLIYISGLTQKEIPSSLLVLFAFGFLVVPLTRIDKSDVVSGLLYACFGMFSAALVFFIPSNYLNRKEYLGQLTLNLLAFSLPPLYFWFKDYGKVLVVAKETKQIDYELTHANDAFKEAMDEGNEI